MSGASSFVDGGPVGGGQAGGFADQQGGAPFVELPGFEGGEGVRHFGDEGFGQAEEPAAFGGGFAPGEGDLRADPGPEVLGGDPGGGLVAALEAGRRRRRSGPAGLPAADFASSSSRSWSIIPGAVRGGEAGGDHADQAGRGHRRGFRPGGRIAPGTARGAAEAGVAVSRRNHFGPLIAVHESSVSGTTDNNGRTVPPARQAP